MGTFAQDPVSRNLSTADGLPSSSVYRVMQDHGGYLWFATESGLGRFDGHQVTRFDYEDGLSSNDVLEAYPDSRGRIWLLPHHTELCYWEEGRVHDSRTDPWLSTMKAASFFANCLEESDGAMLFADNKGSLLRLHRDLRVEKLDFLPAESRRYFYALFRNKAGESMLCTNAELWNLTRETRVDTFGGQLSRWTVPRVIPLGADSHLVGIASSLILVVGDEAQVLRIEGPRIVPDILFMYRDIDGSIWFCTRDGAVQCRRYAIGDGIFRSEDYIRLLEGRSVTSVMRDHEGNHWMSTSSDGVFFFPSITAQSYHGPSERGQEFAKRVLVDRRGVVWVGFDRSLIGRLDGKDWTTHTVDSGTNLGTRGRTNAIYEDPSGTIFVVLDGAMFIQRPDGRGWEMGTGAKSIISHAPGAYLLAHGWTLDSLRMNDLARFEAMFDSVHADTLKFTGMRVMAMELDGSGGVYFGTLTGLSHWGGGREAVREVDMVPKVAISDVMVAADGRVWFSTLTQGIGYLQGGQMVSLTRDDGLISNICNALCMDGRGMVYVATNRGISRIEPQASGKLIIRSFGTNFGLASDEVQDVAIGNGKIYAATSKGLSILDEGFLSAAPPRLPVNFTRFMAGGQVLLDPEGPVVVEKRNNHISVTYTAISFRNAGQVRYAYRLGTEERPGNWIPTTVQQLEFPALAAGAYRLEVLAVVDGWPGTASRAVLLIEVLPAFWETAWFIGLSLLLGVALLAGIFYLAWRRLRAQERRRAEINRRITESEQKALRAQMNPHFIFNSLNSIEHFFITGRPAEANAFIADFSDLMRSILDISGKPAIDLREELRFVGLFLNLESHRLDHRFSHALEVDAAIDLDGAVVPPMIVQPFVENSVWHGVAPLEKGDGKIWLRVRPADGGYRIVVEDNGIGRARSEELKQRYRKKHKSSGIRITRERLELLNMDLPGPHYFGIEVEDLLGADGKAAGTRVTIFIPHTFTD